MSAYNEKRATARSSAAPETGEGQVSQSNDYFITTIIAMQHAKEERTGIKRVSVADRVLKELRKYAGSDIGVSRQMLASATGYSDRAIRDAIEDLIDAGHPIGLGTKRGYTYGSLEGMKRKYYDYMSRRNNMSRKIMRLSRTMQLEGQEEVSREILVPEL